MTFSIDQIRRTQTPAEEIRGSLVVGFSIEGLGDAAAFTALHAFAKNLGLDLFFGGGDAENTPDEHVVSLYPWVVGREMIGVTGGYEQRAGFSYTPGGKLDGALAEVGAKHDVLAEFAKEHGATVSAIGTYLVARGGLALCCLMKGKWIDAPTDEAGDDDDSDDDDDDGDDEAALDAWLSTHREPFASPDSGVVGFRGGTKGASQYPFPGVIHGICIAGAEATAERVSFSAESDAALNDSLAQAGITEPKYFLITQYD